jgi:16S rRNA (cytidine1402-2'-O)-methyltransferase
MNNTMNNKGQLYIVATPIGNLGDISQRAISTLSSVDLILAEDTRHSKILLSKLNIHKEIRALHEHNELEQVEKYCRSIIDEGKSLALISDAGTPLISDPGYLLVRKAQVLGIKVVPIPGASALITALSASGLATDRFIFEGFLSAKSTARRKRLETLSNETRTLVFYEAPHRILETLQDMSNIFGETREAVLARELTKTFETIRRASLIDLFHFVNADTDQSRGEIVLLVAGATQTEVVEEISEEVIQILKILAAELPPKQAASLAAKITGISKRALYDWLVK